MQYLKRFCIYKNFGKFAYHNFQKLCHWPRPFLPLASRGSVLEKSVLNLGQWRRWEAARPGCHRFGVTP